MAVFLEIFVFGQGTVVLPLKTGVFLIVYVPKLVYVLCTSQRCNVFVKNRAGISVCYKTFPGIYSANCCPTRRIAVKSERDVWQLRRNSGRV